MFMAIYVLFTENLRTMVESFRMVIYVIGNDLIPTLTLNMILLKHEVNQERNKVLDEFKFQHNRTKK